MLGIVNHSCTAHGIDGSREVKDWLEEEMGLKAEVGRAGDMEKRADMEE